jgi:hypothetical protein
MILTGAEHRQSVAAGILAAEAEAAAKAQRKEIRLATKAAKAAQKATMAAARTAKKVAQASRPVKSTRTRKPIAKAETAPVLTDESVAEPVAGVKRRAEAPALVAPGEVPEAMPQVMQKRVRLLVRKPE